MGRAGMLEPVAWDRSLVPPQNHGRWQTCIEFPVVFPLQNGNSIGKRHSPSGGSDMGGVRQYMWYPRSQSSQNSS